MPAARAGGLRDEGHSQYLSCSIFCTTTLSCGKKEGEACLFCRWMGSNQVWHFLSDFRPKCGSVPKHLCLVETPELSSD